MINAIVAFKKAVAEIGFKKAIAHVDFKQALATIKLGDFLIFRFFFETLGLSDVQAKNVGKSLADSQNVTDLTVTGVSKPLSDNSGTADAATLEFGTVQNDFGATSDQIDTFAIGKNLNETPNFTEETAFAVGMLRADVFYAAESISVGSGKVFDDSSGAIDEESLQFIKALTDASGATDETLLSPNKVVSDNSGTTDNQNMDFHKFIDEIAGVTDDLDGEATAEDDQEMTFTKVRSDLATIVDLFTYSSNKGLSDTIGSSDSGSIRGQSYCAFDYFAEDYVGYSQNF